MKLTFDYYHNLENIDLRLCNPDERELFPIPGENRNLALRFNDLSELTFDVYSTTTLSDGTVVELEAYDYIRTKRLVYAANIGWFQISNVTEEDDGKRKCKSVTAQSYQSVFKNKGFMSEERVYCFYNPNDPYDDRYDSKQEDSIPSVLGQMYKQLGIKQALSQGRTEPDAPYADWTVTYIPPSFIYNGVNSVCRTFKENATFGYDWMVNDVEEAFEVIVLFDFMYKTIHVRLPNSVSEKADVLYTFNGLMKSVEVSENADDIVTVLNCNGDNCDITAVNPTGTNYICDFSYYMDKVNHRWMSAELIAKLERWKADCDAEKPSYTSLIQRLRGYYKNQTECETDLQAASLSLQNLKNAQAKRGVLGSGTAGSLCGTEAVENVKSGKLSLETASEYCKSPFSGSAVVTAYQNAPTFDENTGGWQFSGASKSGTADSIVADNMASNGSSAVAYWYFSDVSDGSSYCKLKIRASVNKDSPSASYSCDGFDRYIAYRYPTIQEGSGTIVYCDDIHVWISRWEQVVAALNSKNTSLQANIDATNSSLSVITNKLNILSYFSNAPTLLRELNCYWIEGDYTNDHIAVLDETTPEEEIDLSNELLSSGYAELSKVCQPRFSFSLESINATKIYEFREQMQALELGKVVTIEKEEGVWYYPALLEISINLDDSNTFNMTFANATRLDDWGYTYADLISTSSSTSRQVSANWQNITAYAKEKEKISSLIKEPLDTTLRASFANMVNQEFSVDQNGVLGRKRLSMGSDTFEKEQVRLINNLLIFTDDEWKTAKTALGKVYYKDDDGNLTTAYGLVAETIIGSLIMGEKLKIKNGANTVEIGENGIAIHKDNGDTVFTVDTSGKINICNNFIVDAKGNIALNGNITWGTGASPTQAVYAPRALTRPTNGRKWSSFPVSGSGWHQSCFGTDYYVSYTYDGGTSWTDAVQFRGIDGQDGAQVKYLYYRKVTSIAPSAPQYDGSEMPSGWTEEPSGVTLHYKYEFVSQATVIDGEYGVWSTPVLWAKYGEDGSDAEVTAVNIFNAVTENGTKKGCFTYAGNDLYINADYIQTGMLAADRIDAERLHVKAANIDGTLTASQIEISVGGRNYLRNSSFNQNFNNWYAPGNPEISTIDGATCGHFMGELGTDKLVSQPIIQAIDTNDLSQTYVFSADIRLDNFIAGTTNCYVALYFGGTDTSGEWLGAITISGDKYLDRFNDKGWVRVYRCVKFAKKPFRMDAFIYARDFTGDLYFKNVKFERGNKPTDWTPAPEDTEATVTKITNDTIATTNVVAQNLHVKAANIDGALTFGDGSYYIDPGATTSYLKLPGLEIANSRATFDGVINAKAGGTIGGFDIGALYLSRGGKLGYGTKTVGVYIGSDGLGLGNGTFYVRSADGYAHMQKGEIAGWSISEESLTKKLSSEIGRPILTLGNEIMLQHTTGTDGSIYNTYVVFGWGYGTEFSTGSAQRYPYYGINTNSNLAFTVGSGRKGKLVGTWISDNDISDVRLKNSIGDYTDAYDIFFDSLKPKRYKYNSGTSGRYHTGFIAQEVVEAVESSGLSTSDFAGVMLVDGGTESEVWALRRDEFVSLNTWQIQKLKESIKRLESEIANLKTEKQE